MNKNTNNDFKPNGKARMEKITGVRKWKKYPDFCSFINVVRWWQYRTQTFCALIKCCSGNFKRGGACERDQRSIQAQSSAARKQSEAKDAKDESAELRTQLARLRKDLDAAGSGECCDLWSLEMSDLWSLGESWSLIFDQMRKIDLWSLEMGACWSLVFGG